MLVKKPAAFQGKQREEKSAMGPPALQEAEQHGSVSEKKAE